MTVEYVVISFTETLTALVNRPSRVPNQEFGRRKLFKRPTDNMVIDDNFLFRPIMTADAQESTFLDFTYFFENRSQDCEC